MSESYRARIAWLFVAALFGAALLLFGQARILDGAPPDDPAEFADRMATLMQSAL